MKIRLIIDRLTGKAIMAGDKAIAVRSTDALNIQQTSSLSQADYDALATKDTATLYLISGTSGYVKAYIGDSPLYREPEPRTVSGTSAIVFSSIDGGLIKSLVRYGKCQQGSVPVVTAITQQGKCEQRKLPSAYTQLDYIGGNGTTSFLDTGIVLNTVDLDVELDFQFIRTASSTPRMAWGYAGNTSGNYPRWGFGVYGSRWTGSPNQTANAGTNDTNRHTAVMRVFMDGENPKWDGTLDGNELYAPTTLQALSAFTANTVPIMLFARNNNGTAGNFTSVKIYSFKVWKAGKLINDLIPCKRNADNAAGVYDVVNGVFMTGTDISAGTAAVPTLTPTPTPTPNAPVDIVCNNGVLKYSANMANVNEQTALVGYYISAQGVVTADSMNWFYQSFIPVKPNTTYTLSMSSPVYYVTISEYSTAADSGFIVHKTGSTGSNTSLTITTGANTNYIRFGTNINRTAVTLAKVLAINWMLNLGGTAMDYQPYVEGGIYADGTPEVLTVGGKNIFDIDTVGIEQGAIASANGANINANYRVRTAGYVPAKPSTQYTISAVIDGYTSGASRGVFVLEYSAESAEDYIGSAGGWRDPSGYSFTTRADTRFIRIVFAKDASGGERTYPSDVSNIQLEYGNTATAYQPYVTPQTVTNIPMLLGVGDTKDTAEIISCLLTHKIGIYVFTGEESFTKGSAFYTTNTSFLPSKAGGITPICTHFKGISSSATRVADSLTMTVNGPTSGVFTGCVYFYADRSLYETAADFQAWLATQYAAGTPVIVLYPLATETTEQTTAHPELTNGKYATASAEGNVDDITVTVTRVVTSTPTPYNPIPVMCNNGEVTGQGASGTPEVLTLSAAGETDQTATVVDLLQVGDYKDEVELISGLLTHRIGIVVFDGTEAWRTSSSGADIYILTSEIGVNLTAICTHFVKVSNTTSAANMSDGAFKGHPSQTVLYFKDEAVGSLANFKAYLAAQYAAGTPVIVLYKLATPATEQVTPQPLICHMGTNEVESVCNVSDPLIEIIYPE